MRFTEVRIFLFCLISSLYSLGTAQSNTSFPILNFNTTARNSALGGINVGIFDHDPSTSIQLPSNLTPLQDGLLQMNYVNYFADSDIAILNYTFDQKKVGVLSTSLIYCNYGYFEYADPSGQFLDQTFSVNDIMFQLGHGRKLSDKLQIGINMKLAGSFKILSDGYISRWTGVPTKVNAKVSGDALKLLELPEEQNILTPVDEQAA